MITFNKERSSLIQGRLSIKKGRSLLPSSLAKFINRDLSLVKVAAHASNWSKVWQ